MPRVARHELPWVIGQETSPTATRLRPVRSARAPGFGHNAVGVVSTSRREPKVGAGRANLGLKDAIPLGLFFHSSRIHRHLHSLPSDHYSSTTHPRDSHIYASTTSKNPNGILSQCPGLRGTSYPGSSARNLPNRN